MALKFQCQIWSSLERYCALLVYIIFIWVLAYIQRDYLWIAGDDPNLLAQSILITKGFVPNIDFFSGYPGLSLHIHALIIQTLGVVPSSEHIYGALQASALGAIFFWVGRGISSWVILLLLVLIYSQGLALNPSPNPGYLFDVAFIVGLKKSIDCIKYLRMLDAFYAGFFFAIAFLAKQYGIFGPICFFMALLALLDIRPVFRKSIFSFVLLIVSGSILYLYIGKLIPSNDNHQFVLSNALLFIVPTMVGLMFNLYIDRLDASRKVGLLFAFKSNLVMASSFFGVALLYFLIVYGASGLLEALNQVMLLAPALINKWLVPVNFSGSQFLPSVYALSILFAPVIVVRLYGSQKFIFLYPLTAIALSYFLFKCGNLSATIFIVSAFIILVFLVAFFVDADDKRITLAFLAGLAPFFLILTPYPNFAYHIPVLAFFILFCYPREIIIPFRNNQPLFLAFTYTPLLAVALALSNYVIIRSQELQNLSAYSYKNIIFRSGDEGWTNSIKQAQEVEISVGNCTSSACRYLLLTQPFFTEYDRVIEKPVGK